jgi:DNA-binding XRE family transcriptional regulator
MEREVNETTIPFERVLKEQLKDAATREAYEDLSPAYLVALWRHRRGLTQQQLAELVGTQQPSIARLESGSVSPSFAFLRRVAKALGVKMELRFTPDDAPSAVASPALEVMATPAPR